MSQRKPLGYIILTLKFWQEDDQWVGRCEELTTSACGKTFDEVREALDDLVLLHLSGLEDVGRREQFLRQRGIPFYKTAPRRRAKLVPARVGEYVAREILSIPAGC